MKMYFDGYDYIIAESAKDAAAISQEEYLNDTTINPEDFDEFNQEKFTVITDDIILSKKTQSTDEWIKEKGRGILCGIDEGFYED